MLDNLRRQVRAEAEATLDKALGRARREAVQALRRAILSLIGVVLALFGLGYASFAAFLFLRTEVGALWAATALGGLLFALAAICIGFAAILGRRPGASGTDRATVSQDDADRDGIAATPGVADAPAPATRATGPRPPVDPARIGAAASAGAVAPATQDTYAEARGTLQAVMGAVSDEIENDTARAILREGTRQVGSLSTVQMGLFAAVTGFLYAQNAPRRRR